jgi:hypothetical protein
MGTYVYVVHDTCNNAWHALVMYETPDIYDDGSEMIKESVEEIQNVHLILSSKIIECVKCV